jgi:SNF2 family DNA or RNA helicase
MLSSDNTASGTNLTKATVIILVDPMSGDYKKRKDTERQAIGRAHRTGQKYPVTVVRFIIKNSIEEDIYNQNITEDAKYVDSKDYKQLEELDID